MDYLANELVHCGVSIEFGTSKKLKNSLHVNCFLMIVTFVAVEVWSWFSVVSASTLSDKTKPLFWSYTTFENFNCQWHTEIDNLTKIGNAVFSLQQKSKTVVFSHHCSLKVMLMGLFDWNNMKKAINCVLTSQISSDTMTFQGGVTSGDNFNFRFLSQLVVFEAKTSAGAFHV